MANLSSLNELPNSRVFVAAENGSVEELELVALFLLKTGTFGAKNCMVGDFRRCYTGRKNGFTRVAKLQQMCSKYHICTILRKSKD